VDWRLFAVRLGQGHYGDPEPVVVEQQESVVLPVVLAVRETLEVQEEVELAPFADLEAQGDLGECAEVLAKGGPRVGKVQSNCIGILEACPPSQ
jgi:hypothetical protein